MSMNLFPSLGERKYRLTQTIAPTVEPISVADVKSHSRIDTTTDDVYLQSLIGVARRLIERDQQCQLITATWQLKLDSFPVGFQWDGWVYPGSSENWSGIEIPLMPVQAITSISYVDVNGTTQSFTDYELHKSANRPAVIIPTFNNWWPIARWQPDAVTVTFTAGYGATGDSVPETTRHLMYLLVSHWYENREPAGANMSQLPFSLDALMQAERWHGYP
jgi:uncharacterized phiE125 gp8 family phage protein